MRLSSAVLLKFRHIAVPSPGLSDLGEIHLDLDLLFDAMKRMQQYPHVEPDQNAPPGTPLIDWTSSADIGIFFANRGRLSDQEGALFVLDATATGEVQQTKSVEEILKTVEAGLYDQPRSPSLLFSPSKQTNMARAKVQKAQHFAQMDMRFDLEAVWRMLELSFGRRVLLKIILPAGSNDLFSNQLLDLTEQFVMPDESSNSQGARTNRYFQVAYSGASCLLAMRVRYDKIHSSQPSTACKF